MNKYKAILVAVAVGMIGAKAFGAGSISAVESYAAPQMVSEINVALQEGDVRLDALEGTTGVTAVVSGTLSVGGVSTFSSNVVVGGSVTAISADDSTTNVIVTTAAAIDGEYIGADTIDDDSIDFGDVTGADLTLTDCAAVTASGAVYGGTVGFSAATGYFAIGATTQLWFVASSGGVTNVIDADITN